MANDTAYVLSMAKAKLTLDQLDRVRRRIRARVASLPGVSLASASRAMKRDPSYLYQFIWYGSPRKLDEDDRAMLARYLGLPEEDLRMAADQPFDIDSFPSDNEALSESDLMGEIVDALARLYETEGVRITPRELGMAAQKVRGELGHGAANELRRHLERALERRRQFLRGHRQLLVDGPAPADPKRLN